MNLSELNLNQTAIITELDPSIDKTLQNRLSSMGIVKNKEIQIIHIANLGRGFFELCITI